MILPDDLVDAVLAGSLPRSALLLSCAIARSAGSDWMETTLDELAEMIGQHRVSVSRTISALTAAEYLDRERGQHTLRLRLRFSVSANSTAPSPQMLTNDDGTPLPDGFPSNEELAHAELYYPHLDMDRVARQFRAHYKTAGIRRRSWASTWARWLKTAHKDTRHDVQDRSSVRDAAIRRAIAQDPFAS